MTPQINEPYRPHKNESEFYRAPKILDKLADALTNDAKVRSVYLNESARGVPYISFTARVGNEKMLFSACWFASNPERSFRGFKLFWKPYFNELEDQEKRKFPVVAVGEPTEQINKAMRNLIKFIKETKS